MLSFLAFFIFFSHFKTIILGGVTYNLFYYKFLRYVLLTEINNIFIWTIICMTLIMILILYMSFKKIGDIGQSLIFINCFFNIFIVVIYLHTTINPTIFILLFESILYFLINVQLLFIFSNRFLFAVLFLTNFSLISGILGILFLCIL